VKGPVFQPCHRWVIIDVTGCRFGMGAAQNGERDEEEQPLHLMYLQTNASV
jgi:hypothetical protein